MVWNERPVVVWPLGRQILWVVLLVLGVYLIGANKAWLNPTEYGPTAKFSERYPILWQYNPDAILELSTSAFFPEIYRTVAVRINRPGMHLVVKPLSMVLRPLTDVVALRLIPPGHNPTEFKQVFAAAVAFTLVSFSLWVLAGVLFVRVAGEYLGSAAAFLGVFFAYTHHFMLEMATLYHTMQLQVLTPMLVAFLAHSLYRRYSHAKVVWYSLLVGLLMLTKQNYAPYAAVCLLALCYRKYLPLGLSLLCHLVPVLLWIGYCKVAGYHYYNYEAEAYGQGVWLYRELLHMPLLEMLKVTLQGFGSYLSNLMQYATVFCLLAPAALALLVERRQLPRPHFWFVLALALFGMLQMFAAKRYFPYMASDVAPLLQVLGAWLVLGLMPQGRPGRYALWGICLVWLLGNVLALTELPWVHPYAQQ